MTATLLVLSESDRRTVAAASTTCVSVALFLTVNACHFLCQLHIPLSTFIEKISVTHPQVAFGILKKIKTIHRQI